MAFTSALQAPVLGSAFASNGRQRPLPAAKRVAGVTPGLTYRPPLGAGLAQPRIWARDVRQHAASVPAGGGGDIGGTGGFGGGGGGGGDGDAGKRKAKGGLIKGWEERVAADPEFAYKVFVEQVIGVGASVVGDMASRPNWGLSELDFVFATVVVGSIVNFSLMYLLASTGNAAASTAKMGFFQKMFSETTLKNWGAPGGHMFEPGFGFQARAVNFMYKGVVFAFVGMCAGLAGTSISNGLLVLRQKLDPNFHSPNQPPNILYNAATWSLHMGVSSNLRYQMLNGMDMVVQPVLNPGLFKLLTSVIRAGNNMIGGISFVMLAKLFGVQQSADPTPKET